MDYPLKGFEGYYIINDDLEIFSIEHVDSLGRMQGGNKINPSTNTKYPMVGLTIEGKTKSYYIHRLVAQTFIAEVEDKPFVHHRGVHYPDGSLDNRYDYSVENLEWVNHEENQNAGDLRKRRSIMQTGKPTNKGVRIRVWNDDGFNKSYDKMIHASKELGLQPGNLSKVVRGYIPHTCGYYAEYLED